MFFTQYFRCEAVPMHVGLKNMSPLLSSNNSADSAEPHAVISCNSINHLSVKR